MLKRRRNARCTAVAGSVLMNSGTQKILCCIVAILSQLTLLHGCALGESSSGGISIFRISSLKCYVVHSYTIYSSGNIEVRNWIHHFESRCICGFSAWELHHVTLLAPSILRWCLDFLKRLDPRLMVWYEVTLNLRLTELKKRLFLQLWRSERACKCDPTKTTTTRARIPRFFFFQWIMSNISISVRLPS